MFIHSVYFYLARPDSADDRDALMAGLRSLTGINAIQNAQIGTPAATRRPVIDHTYDAALILTFADQAAHDVYQDHPVHHEFVAECKHLWERVQIYDIETT